MDSNSSPCATSSQDRDGAGKGRTGFEALTLPAPRGRTLSEQVASQLRRAILDGRLKPGQRLVEREIAEAMEMSRGPVRDALHDLEHERLVVRSPHRGTSVAWLSLRDAEEIYSLREALETLIVRYAVEYATDEQLDELNRIADRMAAPRELTQYEATDLDLEFHHLLCRISGHRRVLSAWTALRSQVHLLILTHRLLQPSDFRERGAEWHRRLVDVLRQRDARLAESVLRQHIGASFTSVVEAINRRETGFTPSGDHTDAPTLQAFLS